jgi:hypothetical protein
LACLLAILEIDEKSDTDIGEQGQVCLGKVLLLAHGPDMAAERRWIQHGSLQFPDR